MLLFPFHVWRLFQKALCFDPNYNWGLTGRSLKDQNALQWSSVFLMYRFVYSANIWSQKASTIFHIDYSTVCCRTNFQMLNYESISIKKNWFTRHIYIPGNTRFMHFDIIYWYWSFFNHNTAINPTLLSLSNWETPMIFFY